MKYVLNIPHTEVEKIRDLKGAALININEEDRPEYPLKVSGPDILKLKFSDVRAVVEHKGKFYNPMSVDQAHDVLDFLKKNQDRNIIVNCAAGISRSSAIALFCHMVYNHELKPNFWHLSEPNPYILGTLICEYYKKL